ncbi:MAG: hypothetical protein LH469_13015 [Frankiaceae bacterium]|nr:hypothetical protein [Frankiaceae bacterium]
MSLTASRLQRVPRRRWVLLAGVAVAAVLLALWWRSAFDAQPAPARWAADAEAPPSGNVTVFQAPPDLPALSKSPFEDEPREGYGVRDAVVAPDGTVWVQQDRRFFEIDNQSLQGWDSRGRALLALRPDGVVEVLETPYDDNDVGVVPLCAGSDGTLFARADSSAALVARSPAGQWREVTATAPADPYQYPRNDGGPASETFVGAEGCALEADGDLLVLDGCTVRRIDQAGVITTVAGREVPGDLAFGCGEADNRESSVPSPEPLLLSGPATATDLPRMVSIAIDADGGVWLGSLVGLRRLEPQPDGSYVIATVQTRAFGRQEDIRWSVTEALTDIAPLDDGRVLVLGQAGLFVLGTDGVLRGTDLREHRRIAVRGGQLLSSGPVADGGEGLRLAQIPHLVLGQP